MKISDALMEPEVMFIIGCLYGIVASIFTIIMLR